MRIAAGVIATLLLSACGEQRGQTYSDEAVAVEIIAPPASSGATLSTQASATSLAVSQVAYVYHYRLELPVDRAVALMTRHEQACVQAGPTLCQVIGSETTQAGGEGMNGRLEIRATPAWLARLRASLASDAKAAGGKIASSSTESEDLTRSLIDTEARLRAQTTLRDRLQQLLATRTGDLEQLLKVESELARVQGEIDTVQSTLAVLRTRVAMSRLEVSYQSPATIAGDSAFAPLAAAVTGAFRTLIQSLAVLVTLLAVILPFALIGAPLGWWVLKRRRTLQARTTALKTTRAASENAAP